MLTNQQPSLVELNATIEPPQALPDRVYSVLKYRILTCTMVPGQRLNEKEIANELKVSRTPLREALNRLSQENLLVRTPYCGYAVSVVTEDDIRDLCESRLILETATAGLAAERATPVELERMTQLVELRYTPGDRVTYARYLKANSIFHRELRVRAIMAGSNQWSWRFWTSFKGRYISAWMSVSTPRTLHGNTFS